MAKALLDRLLHHSIVITITGISYRLQDHMELVPDHIRARTFLLPPPPPDKRGVGKNRKEVKGIDRAPFVSTKMVFFK